jgi:hypothetical protein
MSLSSLARREYGAHANGCARPDQGGERAAFVGHPCRTLEPCVVDPVGTRAHVELGGDDQMPFPLDLVERDRAADVEPLDGAARPGDLARQ